MRISVEAEHTSGELKMAVNVTVSAGYDLDFAWRRSAEGDGAEKYRGAGFYPASGKTREPPGTWWGPGAAALGLQPGAVADYGTYCLLLADRTAPDGTRLADMPGGPLYYDVTVILSKSISIFHVSLGENLRQARKASDREGVKTWASGRPRRCDHSGQQRRPGDAAARG
jgi:hypothetical protein